MSLISTKTVITKNDVDADVSLVLSKNRVESNSSIVGGTDGTQIGNSGDKLKTDGSGVTQPISAASLPLPTGAATSANQTTANSSLSSIDGKLVNNFGVSTAALRSAAIIGNASGVADFGSGNSSSQTIRTIAAADQPSISITLVGQSYLTNNQAYSAAADINGASAGTDNPMLLIRNPLGSGKAFYLEKIYFGTKVANVSYLFKMWSMPTVTTNGSTITPVPAFVNNGAPASVILVTSLPTISSAGSLMLNRIYGQNAGGVDILEDFGIAIKAGGSILITGDPGSNNRIASISVAWAEV